MESRPGVSESDARINCSCCKTVVVVGGMESEAMVEGLTRLNKSTENLTVPPAQGPTINIKIWGNFAIFETTAKKSVLESGLQHDTSNVKKK